MTSCFDNYRLSSAVAQLTGSKTLGEVTKFVEVGSEISLSGDLLATGYKAAHASIGNEPWASAMNFGFRSLGRAIGNPAFGRALTRFGDTATPVAAAIGALSAAYNGSTYNQCRAGLL